MVLRLVEQVPDGAAALRHVRLEHAHGGQLARGGVRRSARTSTSTNTRTRSPRPVPAHPHPPAHTYRVRHESDRGPVFLSRAGVVKRNAALQAGWIHTTHHQPAKQPTMAVPASARCVIIGGGVAGVSTAYHLAAKKGWTDVVLLERHLLTSGKHCRPLVSSNAI